jgi:hypothetical protein
MPETVASWCIKHLPMATIHYRKFCFVSISLSIDLSLEANSSAMVASLSLVDIEKIFSIVPLVANGHSSLTRVTGHFCIIHRGCLVHCLKWLTLLKVSRSIWRANLRHKKLDKVSQVSHKPNSPIVTFVVWFYWSPVAYFCPHIWFFQILHRVSLYYWHIALQYPWMFFFHYSLVNLLWHPLWACCH